MTNENFDQAMLIKREVEAMEDWLELKETMPSHLTMEVSTANRTGGGLIEFIDAETATKAVNAVRAVVEQRIKDLMEKFSNL